MPPTRGTRFYVWVAVGGAWSLFLGTGLALLVAQPLAALEGGTFSVGATSPVNSAVTSTLTELLRGAYTTGITSIAVGLGLLALGVRLSLRTQRMP